MIAITKPFSVISISRNRRLASALVLAMVCCATPSAAEFSLASVTAAERAACKPDVLRLCASEIPNVGRIIACMKRKRASLSPACSAVVEAKLASQKAAGKTATRSVRASAE